MKIFRNGRYRIVWYKSHVHFVKFIWVSFPIDADRWLVFWFEKILVFGDIDGVCIIPQEIEKKVIDLAYDKVKGENLVRKSIESGMTTVEAFNKFGIMWPLWR